jgi:hypothetical protein
MPFLANRAALFGSFWSVVPLVFLLAFVLSGCVSQVPPPPVPVKLYAGPELPESEISVIHRRSGYAHRWWSPKVRTLVEVLTVDGERYGASFHNPGRLDPFHVLPGKHKVRVKITGGEGRGSYRFMTSDSYGEIEFSTKAGNEYLVLSRRVYDLIYKRFGIFVPGENAGLVDLGVGGQD